MTKYGELYKKENIQGPGDSRPTALQIIRDEGLEGGLTGQVILLTGSSSGIGVETARALAATGATLFLGVRDVQKARRVHADILTPNIKILELDISRLESVHKAAEDLLRSSENRLNLIINNAGVLAPPEFHIGGLESQMAVHFWGPFLLFHLLKDSLISSSTSDHPSRVINVTSKAHQVERIDFKDPHLRLKSNPFEGYGRSKLAQVYMAREIERRYGRQGLHGYSLDPGVIREGSEIDRHVKDLLKDSWNNPILQSQLMTPAQGAATTIWASVSKEALLEEVQGMYLEFCGPAMPTEGKAPGIESGYGSWAYDATDARKLWDLGLEVVGLSAMAQS